MQYKNKKQAGNKTILVTGVAGFIGGNFAQQFKKQFSKTAIIGIDDFSSGRESVVHSIKPHAFYKGSVADTSLLEKIFKKHKPEYIFHFAAIPRVSFSIEHPRKTSDANITGTVALLEMSHKYDVKRFIYSSSSSLYGGAKKLPTKESENPADPKSPYALQKYAGELFCKQFSELYGLDTVCLRYFNVFGPGQFGDSPYSTVISAWLEALFGGLSPAYGAKRSNGGTVPPVLKSARPFLEGNGKQSRDFCFVDNAVASNIKAMQAKKRFNGECFNIAHGERTTLLEIKRLLEKYTKKKLNLERRPPRVGDVRHTHADISKAKRLLGYKIKTPLEKGLIKTIEWHEGQK